MPPWIRTQSAVPRTLYTRLEIAKAIRTLAAADDDDRQRPERLAETAALQRDFAELAQSVGALCRKLRSSASAARLQKYSPDEPRVPAGRPEGGEWTKGDIGDGSSPASSATILHSPGSPVRYAALQTGTLTDATDTRANAGDADGRYTPDILTNLRSLVGAALWRKYRVIGADEIPADHPKHPVELVDSSGRPLLDDQGKAILRPADLPPEAYVQAGLAARAHLLPQYVHQFNQAMQSEAVEPSAMAGVATRVFLELSPFLHGGTLDAERYDSNYVRDYRHHTSIATGIFMAAAGVSREDALAFADAYASLSSKFDPDESKDKIYRHSTEQDIEDNLRGYDLYESGRVRSRRD